MPSKELFSGARGKDLEAVSRTRQVLSWKTVETEEKKNENKTWAGNKRKKSKQ